LNVNNDLKRYFFILYKLAGMGALKKTIKASTGLIANETNFSQQTVSRHLIELERIGWIKRIVTHEGTFTRISSLGEVELRRVFSGLNRIFAGKYLPVITIEGSIIRGLGEGAYYVNCATYRNQFIEKLGFDPYPGTLNLKINSEYELMIRSELEAFPGIKIKGFKNKNRSYGSVKCFHALINDKEKGAVISALRSHYDQSIIEIIAPVNLRQLFKLKDGNKIKVDILLTKA
jgi:riboflavin kinase